MVLLIIYMNDAVDNIKHSKFAYVFAGDIILCKGIVSERDVQQLQEDLNSLQQLGNIWLLKFSIPKCLVLQVIRPTQYKILFSYYNT